MSLKPSTPAPIGSVEKAVARDKILEANIKSSKETIEQLPGVLSSIRGAWLMVEKETSGRMGIEPAQEAPRRTHAAPAAASETETSHGRWDS